MARPWTKSAKSSAPERAARTRREASALIEPTRYRGRFAPSPSGALHFGSLVAALASYLDARAHAGVWLVRIEDIDPGRTRPSAEHEILALLAAHGLESDEPVWRQSERLPHYAAALDALVARNAVFPCACTRAEAKGRYSGRCRAGLPQGLRARSLRVRVDDVAIRFEDRAQGLQAVALGATCGDFIVRRADGCFAYHLAVTVDDAAQRITHVVRGTDLLESAAPQIHLQRLLGFPTPSYLHVPVVVDRDGRKLSKQNRAPALDPHNAVATLVAALRVLRQDAPAALERSPLESVLAWAIEHWRPESLRGVTQHGV